MKLENLKSIKVLGGTFLVEYMSDKESMGVDGHTNASHDYIMIKESLPLYRKSHTCWHEIIHIIDFLIHIKRDGESLDEDEADRLATALQSLEFEYHDEKNKAEG